MNVIVKVNCRCCHSSKKNATLQHASSCSRWYLQDFRRGLSSCWLKLSNKGLIGCILDACILIAFSFLLILVGLLLYNVLQGKWQLLQ